MNLPANPVLFQLGTSAWTLGGLCVLVACVIFLLWLVLLPSMARRFGQIQSMSSEEAASYAFTGRQTDYVKPEPIVHGPAVGKEWQVSLSIGDLRSAWQRNDRRYFYGYSLYCMLITDSFGLAGFGLAFSTRIWPFLIFSGLALLVRSVNIFMMWAAVYTKLE